MPISCGHSHPLAKYEIVMPTEGQRSGEPALSEVEWDLQLCRLVLEMFLSRAGRHIEKREDGRVTAIYKL
jgi:hypothetical protein